MGSRDREFPPDPPRLCPSWTLVVDCAALKGQQVNKPNSYRGGPDERGRFGLYGGRFVAETLMPLVLQV